MSSQWDAWLRTLARSGKLVEGLAGATRGLKWVELVEVEGNWAGAVMTGGVRVQPDAEEYLAEFTVSVPTISDDYTVFEISLAAGTGANSTGVLPSDTDYDGVETFPFAIHLTPSGGVEELLAGGEFQVMGLVG